MKYLLPAPIDKHDIDFLGKDANFTYFFTTHID